MEEKPEFYLLEEAFAAVKEKGQKSASGLLFRLWWRDKVRADLVLQLQYLHQYRALVPKGTQKMSFLFFSLSLKHTKMNNGETSLTYSIYTCQ